MPTHSTDKGNGARGSHTEYNVGSKLWAQLMAKYVDPLEGGLREKVGYGPKTGRSFFDDQATDVFIEADFQNSVLGNLKARTPYAQAAHARWVWLELVKPDNIKRLGDSILEAIAEGFCYPQSMSDW